MAKVKISGLPAGGALNGTELVPIVQTGTTKRITAQDIANLGNASGVEGSGTINYLAKFSATSTIGNSQIFDNGTNIGIGTATPFGGAKLQIKTSTNINIAFQNGTLDATGVKINAYNDAASVNIPMELNGSILYFKTGETERMRIASTGAATFNENATILKNQNGISGLTAQNNNLTNGAGQGLSFNFDGATNLGGIFHTYNTSLDAYNLSFNAWDGTSSLTRLFINGDNGNCGIGTTAPTQKLQVTFATNKSFAVGMTPYYQPSDYSILGGSIGVSRSSDGRLDLNTFYAYESNTGAENLAITGREDIVFYGNAKEYARFKSNGNVLIGTNTDIASSKLTIDSTTQGVLVPRMTTTQINAIGSPANGLIAYNTTLTTLCFYDGTNWKKVSHSNM